MLNIVLHEPEIPANTGNIGRTCVATNTRLHLIEPLGFRLNEKNLKRAGMDYWEHLDVRTYIDYNDFLEKNPGAKIYMATTKAPKVYTEVNYEPDCYIMFGKESAGIPEEILVEHKRRLRAYPDGRRHPFAEPRQLGCDRALRSTQTERICRYESGGASSRITLVRKEIQSV